MRQLLIACSVAIFCCDSAWRCASLAWLHWVQRRGDQAPPPMMTLEKNCVLLDAHLIKRLPRAGAAGVAAGPLGSLPQPRDRARGRGASVAAGLQASQPRPRQSCRWDLGGISSRREGGALRPAHLTSICARAGGQKRRGAEQPILPLRAKAMISE